MIFYARYVLTLVMLLVTLSVPEAGVSAAKVQARDDGKSAAEMIKKKWGVEVIGIRRTASDYMLDFRFRVLDKTKVGEIMDRKVRPLLEVEGKDIKVNVPVTNKLGSLRQSAKYAKNNKNYFMLFANPGKKIKKGDKVSVTIGKFKVEHLVVQ